MSFRYESEIKKEVHILGQDYICREPTLKEQIEYEKQLKSKNGDEVLDLILDYIASLGVPREATVSLPKSKVLDLMAFLSGASEVSKKK